MELVSVDCPNCGASLPATEPGQSYHCTYCGGKFQLNQAKKAQTQAGVLVDPHTLAQAIVQAQQQAQQQVFGQSSWPQPHATPIPTAASVAAGNTVKAGLGGCFGIVLVGVMVGVAGFFTWFAKTGGAGMFGGEAAENVMWDSAGGVPQIVEVAGKTAVVGRTRAVTADVDALYCAVHNVDGSKIWRTDSLGTYMEGYQSTFCGAAGNVMVVTTPTAQVRLLDLASGAAGKTLELSDVVEYLCVPPNPAGAKQVWIKQLDKREHLLDVTTGELTPSPQPDWCESSRHEAAKRLQGGGSWADADRELTLPAAAGLKLEFMFERAGKAVALGHTDPGTKVPTAVGVDPVDKRVLWTQAVSSVAKATVRDTDKFGAIAGDKFIATYGAGQEDWYITALDLATGARVWETKLRPIFAVDSIDALVANDTHAFLVRTSSLEIFDAKTGELTGTIGRETYDDKK